ncbi:hypothetical protein DM2_2182 [Halorubrum sp. DM2]|uniref:hypothetical protein n=1 Tax=Halorubrum sp. DM2 TaxID=2527867 RepID=UPI0024B71C7E|nr:hypothetical protein [Halorubrum sp. DM2]VTT86144.1 hypothetical protein DM2_2182 [Halorubrum sp. DM2]
MTTRTEDRLYGLALAALLATAAGELLAVPLLVAVGVASVFLTVAALLAVVTAALAVGVAREPGIEMRDAAVVDRSR